MAKNSTRNMIMKLALALLAALALGLAGCGDSKTTVSESLEKATEAAENAAQAAGEAGAAVADLQAWIQQQAS